MSRPVRSTVALLTGLLLAAVPAAPPWDAADPWDPVLRYQLHSLTAEGAALAAESLASDVSADGQHVVLLTAAALLPSDRNDSVDAYVADRRTGQLERVSVATDGSEAVGDVWEATISADGQRVAFATQAIHDTSDTSSNTDVYLRDRDAGTTTLLSWMQGVEHFHRSEHPAISADGRVVAFTTAQAFDPTDVNEWFDVYVVDLATGTRELVSVATDGTQGNNPSNQPAVSAGGRWIAFDSTADNLVPGDANQASDVFLRDRLDGTTTRVSVADDGTGPATGISPSYLPSISADGARIAFQSYANTLVPGDRNGDSDVFVRDVATGRTHRVSVTASGAELDHRSFDADISADGRSVVFRSLDFAATPGRDVSCPAILCADVLVHDLETGDTRSLVPAAAAPGPASFSLGPRISGDGSIVAFEDYASDLLGGGDDLPDVFSVDRGPDLGLDDVELVRTDHGVDVAADATFRVPPATAADDPRGDAAADGTGDIVGASVTYRPDRADVRLRIDLAGLRSVSYQRCAVVDCYEDHLLVGSPGLVAGLRMTLAGVVYEIRGDVVADDRPPAVAPSAAVHRCDPTCVRIAPVESSVGSVGSTVTFDVPLDVLATGVGDMGEVIAFTRLGSSGAETSLPLDDVQLADVTIAPPTVSFGAGSMGRDVTFGAPAHLANGRAVGRLDAPSDEATWARACASASCVVTRLSP